MCSVVCENCNWGIATLICDWICKKEPYTCNYKCLKISYFEILNIQFIRTQECKTMVIQDQCGWTFQWIAS